MPLARFVTKGPVKVSVTEDGQTKTWTQGEQVAIRAAQTGVDPAPILAPLGVR